MLLVEAKFARAIRCRTRKQTNKGDLNICSFISFMAWRPETSSQSHSDNKFHREHAGCHMSMSQTAPEANYIITAVTLSRGRTQNRNSTTPSLNAGIWGVIEVFCVMVITLCARNKGNCGETNGAQAGGGGSGGAPAVS